VSCRLASRLNRPSIFQLPLTNRASSHAARYRSPSSNVTRRRSPVAGLPVDGGLGTRFDNGLVARVRDVVKDGWVKWHWSEPALTTST